MLGLPGLVRGELVGLFAIVTASFTLQIAIHHSATLGRIFGIAPVSWAECVAWIGLGCVPLLALEARKVWRRRTSARRRLPLAPG